LETGAIATGRTRNITRCPAKEPLIFSGRDQPGRIWSDEIGSCKGIRLPSQFNRADMIDPLSANHRSSEMKKDEIRKILSDDIEHFRLKAKYYESLHLFEAEKYAENLASNIELALTTMPSDDDQEIS
jgi:hypothetical protein